jgi:hypothetical protein
MSTQGKCKGCQMVVTPGEPDPCLELLPGVSHACCGHGDYGRAYVVIGGKPNESCQYRNDYLVLYGIPALEFFDLIKMARDGRASSLNCPLNVRKPTPLRFRRTIGRTDSQSAC